MGRNEEREQKITSLERRMDELRTTPIKLDMESVGALIDAYDTMLGNDNNENHPNRDVWEEKHNKLEELIAKLDELDLNVKSYTLADLPGGNKYPDADKIPLTSFNTGKEEYHKQAAHRRKYLATVTSVFSPFVSGYTALVDEVSDYKAELEEISSHAEDKVLLGDAFLDLEDRITDLQEFQDTLDTYAEFVELFPL